MSKAEAEHHVVELLRSLGADPEDPRLTDTPATVAGFLEPFVAQREAPSLSLFPADADGPVSLTGLRFYSLCEHHLVPFFGTIEVTYVPSGQVAGFGGIERCVQHFAKRLQLQERMTRQIADRLEHQLRPRGLRVVSRARQMCLEMVGGSPETVITVSIERGVLDRSGG